MIGAEFVLEKMLFQTYIFTLTNHISLISLVSVWMCFGKIDFQQNWFCTFAQLILVKTNFEVIWFMFECFYYEIKLGEKLIIKNLIQRS